MEKTCSKCAASLPVSSFYKHPYTADGLLAECKDCKKAYERKRRRSNPAVKEYDRTRGNRQDMDYVRNRRAAFPEMYKAHTAVGNAVRDGRLVKEPCLFCGSCERLEGHHRDYSKPLDVVWLCSQCHKRLHANFPETAAHEHKG